MNKNIYQIQGSAAQNQWNIVVGTRGLVGMFSKTLLVKRAIRSLVIRRNQN